MQGNGSVVKPGPHVFDDQQKEQPLQAPHGRHDPRRAKKARMLEASTPSENAGANWGMPRLSGSDIRSGDKYSGVQETPAAVGPGTCAEPSPEGTTRWMKEMKTGWTQMWATQCLHGAITPETPGKTTGQVMSRISFCAMVDEQREVVGNSETSSGDNEVPIKSAPCAGSKKPISRSSIFDDRPDRAIADAFRSGEMLRLEALLEAGASPTFARRAGGTVLHTAAFCGNISVVDALLFKHEVASFHDGYGRMPADFAAMRDHGRILHMLQHHRQHVSRNRTTTMTHMIFEAILKKLGGDGEKANRRFQEKAARGREAKREWKAANERKAG